MSSRFLRHASLPLVDLQDVLNGGITKLFSHQKGETDVITEAMKNYSQHVRRDSLRACSNSTFILGSSSLDQDPHGFEFGHTKPSSIFCHLVEDDEIQWCSDKIDKVARQLFAAIDQERVMHRVGVDGEMLSFIFDEGNVLGSGFLLPAVRRLDCSTVMTTAICMLYLPRTQVEENGRTDRLKVQPRLVCIVEP